MPTLYVNKQPIQFQKGELILPVALRAAQEIPHYCYHPGLSVTAQCRQCLVEITDLGNGKGLPKLQTSCSTPASDGMHISTESPKALAGQQLVNEFLLLNHPLDCSICDQAGECDLQNFAFRYGTGQSEMRYEKRTYGWRDVGSFIVLERNRCIHCSRCERFSREVVGTHDFGMFHRSHELTFDTFSDAEITHPFQGNLADICPVGCIMNKDWRFKKRAWKLRKTESICTSCSTGCNITIEHHKNRVFRVKPRENQEVNRWWMCDEGRLAFRSWNTQRGRIVDPQARVGGTLQRVSWKAVESALRDRIAEIAPTGKQAVALADTYATLEELFLLREWMSEGFGGAQVFFPLVRGVQQEEPSRHVADDFIYTLITTDKSPNTQGARLLGLCGDEKNEGVHTALKHDLKLLVVLGAPFANQQALIQRAKSSALILWIGTQPGPWGDVADVLLPALTAAEQQGTYVNKRNRLQRIQAALNPPPNAREAVQTLSKLIGAPGEAPDTSRSVWKRICTTEGVLHDLSWERVGPFGIPLFSNGSSASKATGKAKNHKSELKNVPEKPKLLEKTP